MKREVDTRRADTRCLGDYSPLRDVRTAIKPNNLVRELRHRVTSSGTLPGRGGFTMLELTAAAAVLGTVFLVTIPLLSQVRDTREDARRRFIAQQEAANVMEHLSLQAADGTLDDAISQEMPVSPEAQTMLPEVNVSVHRAELSDDVGNVRVTVAVSWLDNADKRTVPVSLDAWFPAAKGQP